MDDSKIRRAMNNKFWTIQRTSSLCFWVTLQFRLNDIRFAVYAAFLRYNFFHISLSASANNEAHTQRGMHYRSLNREVSFHFLF